MKLLSKPLLKSPSGSSSGPSSKPLFSNSELYNLLWPLVVEQLLNVLVGMVDVVMVASLGEAAVSGVSLVDSLNQLLIQFLAALTTGGTVVCSQFIGMKRMKEARQSAGQLILITSAGALVIVLLCLAGGRHLLAGIFGQVEDAVMDSARLYLMITSLSFPFLALYNSGAALFRAMGNSRISMKVSLLMNGLNIVGNAIGIYGLKMNVAGVAIPTLISRMAAAVTILWLLQKPQNDIRVSHISELKPRTGLIKKILYIGIPSGIESSMFQMGKLTLQSLVSTLGTASIAGYAVAFNLVTFLYLPGNAMGLGMTTVVGRCVGANEPEQAKRYAWKLIFINYAFLAVLAPVLGIGRGLWITLYNLSGESARIASGLVLSHCIAMIIWPLAFLLPYALRAANDVKFTTFIAIFSMWVFRVSLAYLFVKYMHRSILYIWYAMYIDWIFRMIVFLWRFRGYADRIRRFRA